METKTMKTPTRIAKNKIKPVLPKLSSTSTISSGSAPSTTSTAAAPTPVVIASTAPPDILIPAPPTGFVPVNLLDYRGSHPKAGQITAVPDAVAELESSSSYANVFGAAVPPANQIAGELTVAARWTALRVSAEALLLYLKSFEAITWKTALTDLEKLDAVFTVFAAQNPAMVAAFPQTAKLLEVPKVIGARAASTRARKRKAATTDATTAPATTAASPTAASTGGTGGAGH
jgi:hypothetical protein